MGSIKEIIATAKQIRDGVLNDLKGETPEKNAMIEARMKYCVGSPEEGIATCEHFAFDSFVEKVDEAFSLLKSIAKIPEDERLKDYSGKKCAKCGCHFTKYLVSPEKTCPLGKW